MTYDAKPQLWCYAPDLLAIEYERLARDVRRATALAARPEAIVVFVEMGFAVGTADHVGWVASVILR